MSSSEERRNFSPFLYAEVFLLPGERCVPLGAVESRYPNLRDRIDTIDSYLNMAEARVVMGDMMANGRNCLTSREMAWATYLWQHVRNIAMHHQGRYMRKEDSVTSRYLIQGVDAGTSNQNHRAYWMSSLQHRLFPEADEWKNQAPHKLLVNGRCDLAGRAQGETIFRYDADAYSARSQESQGPCTAFPRGRDRLNVIKLIDIPNVDAGFDPSDWCGSGRRHVNIAAAACDYRAARHLENTRHQAFAEADSLLVDGGVLMVDGLDAHDLVWLDHMGYAPLSLDIMMQLDLRALTQPDDAPYWTLSVEGFYQKMPRR